MTLDERRPGGARSGRASHPARDEGGRRRQRLLDRLEQAWAGFRDSYAGLTDEELLRPGVTGQWSVRDIIAHVTWWEEESLAHLPVVLGGGRPPRYSTRYGGIDAFNAIRTVEKRGLSLGDVLREQAETHRRLLAYLEEVSDEALAHARFRRRLLLDTYGHYPKHAAAIRCWRESAGGTGQPEARSRSSTSA